MNRLHLLSRNLILLLVLGVCLALPAPCSGSEDVPRVAVILNPCLSCGNPDDIHGLIYLLWNSDRLEIEGIIPDSYDSLGNPKGLDAIDAVLKAYEEDYTSPDNHLAEGEFSKPDALGKKVPTSLQQALDQIKEMAQKDAPGPLYVLNWGNMKVIKDALDRGPLLASRIRLISVASRTSYENCKETNLNGWGRNTLFRDPRFKDLWWLEMDWTQEAVNLGEEPNQILKVLANYGSLGRVLGAEGNTARWNTGFHAGDAVSFLYLLDPGGLPADPTQQTWVGRFPQPYPETHPHFYTDDPGTVDWDYEKPCRTWIDRELFRDHCQKTLLNNRSRMDSSLLEKLNGLYSVGASSESMTSYEAENADLTEGLEVKADLQASHGFYVEMRESGKITWVLKDVPEEGTYILTIRYKLPFLYKSQRLIVNGEDIGTIKFDGPPRTWQEKELSLNLHKGRNTVTVEKDWGYMDFDTATLMVGRP